MLLSEGHLQVIAGELNALSPLATLGRGYSATYSDKKLIKSINSISVGDSVTVRLYDGELNATVIQKKEFKNEKQ